MDSAKRVVITGATGLLGRSLVKTFQNCAWNVQGWGFSRADGCLVKRVDVTASAEVIRALDSFVPDVMIHAAAERHPDVIEKNPEGARDLNVEATRFLAEECARRNVKFIYISTDYVFDGTAPPYSESSIPNPLNAYGETKFLGEEATKAASGSHAIFRIPILFGDVQQIDESAVTILFKSLRDSSKPCKMDHVQIRYPTHVDHVSAALLRFCTLFLESAKENSKDGAIDNANFDGIFHFSAREKMTKYEMTMAIADAFEMDVSHVEADTSAAKAAMTTTAAKRPQDATLACERLEKLDITWTSNFREEIKTVLASFI